MMHRLSQMLAFAAVALIGCAGSGFEHERDDDGSDQGAAGALSGSFHTFALPTSDTCASLDTTTHDLALRELGTSSDGKLLFGLDGESLECEAAGDRHVCREEQELLGGAATAATEFSFRPTSATRFEGTFETAISCTAGDCSALGAPTLPCSIEGILVGLEALPDDFTPELGTYDTRVGAPVITTCATAPDVDARQQLRIEVSQDDPSEAQVFSGDDPAPFHCTFEGAGKTACTRILADLEREQIAQVAVAWTSGTSFEGTASLEITPFEVGPQSCLALYHIDGALAK